MAEYRKKLIEVALPLDAINDASTYDKMPGIGPHPKGMHHWWARLPLPCARAVLFASMVDDPSTDPKWADKSEEEQDQQRQLLFDMIRRLVQKKMHEKPEVFREAHNIIENACGDDLPIMLDPFAGGGSILLEAQRLGLEVHGVDLNPVSVLIARVATEMLPRFANQAPVSPAIRDNPLRSSEWVRARGIAEDLRYYAERILEKAKKKIGHLYPRGPHGEHMIAWIWSRTVASPNPSTSNAMVPLARSFWLCPKKGKQVYIEPVVKREENSYQFEVKEGMPTSDFNPAKGTVDRTGAKCLLSGARIPFPYIREQGKAGKIQYRLMAMVYDGGRRKGYLPPNLDHAIVANDIKIDNYPVSEIPQQALGFRVQSYGMNEHWRLFSPRQLCTLTTLSDLIIETHQGILQDAIATGLPDDGISLEEGGNGALAYTDTITTLLTMALDRCTDFNNSLCTWSPSNEKVMHLFGRQAIPMVWDFAEANTLGESVGSWKTCSDYVAKCVEVTVIEFATPGRTHQLDAASAVLGPEKLLVSTDPPYYDNIGYADLSDFFYVWLRRTLGKVNPQLFATMMVPKSQELIASAHRFDGDALKAKDHFESGFRQAFTILKEKLDQRFPMTVYYAFKQEDEKVEGSDERITLTTGWETLLEALNSTGFQITATWPVRASQKWRMRSMGSNALASYIVLACRTRSDDAPLATRKQFISEIRKELPDALRKLQRGFIAPVDLAQAMIGPGMAVFTRFAKVVESDGSPMSIRTALALINQTLDEILTEQEGEFDAETRWAVAWFEQHGMEVGEFGVAETLSKAKNTAVDGLVNAGLITARTGKVQLIPRDRMPEDWDPRTDKRLTAWEATQHLIRLLDQQGETGAADLLQKLGGLGEVARDLAYRLFSICERNDWANEALAYNTLVLAWPEINKLAHQTVPDAHEQITIFEQEES